MDTNRNGSASKERNSTLDPKERLRNKFLRWSLDQTVSNKMGATKFVEAFKRYLGEIFIREWTEINATNKCKCSQFGNVVTGKMTSVQI